MLHRHVIVYKLFAPILYPQDELSVLYAKKQKGGIDDVHFFLSVLLARFFVFVQKWMLFFGATVFFFVFFALYFAALHVPF